MGRLCTAYISALLALLCTVSGTSWEKQLARELDRRYDDLGTVGRPVVNSSEQLVVNSAVHLVQILDLDEHNQFLTTSMKVELRWHDPFLSWNPDDYNGVSTLRLSSTDIWVPDIILSNSVSEEERIDNSLVKISPEGDVTWKKRSVMRTSCQIDMQSYPFDKQHCTFILKSASYSKSELAVLSIYEEGRNLLHLSNCTILKEYIEASEWTILVIKTRSPLLDSSDGDEIEFSLTLQRKAVFFTWILMMPCLFLTMLTLVTFWLPPERPDKTTLAMSIFASFMVLLLVLVGSIPSTASSVPILGIYYFFNMVITALSIILATIVVNINKSQRTKPKVPKWLKMVAIETLGGMFGVHTSTSKVKEWSKERKRRRAEKRKLMQEAMHLDGPNEQRPRSDSHDILFETLKKRMNKKEKEEEFIAELEEGAQTGDDDVSMGYDLRELEEKWAADRISQMNVEGENRDETNVLNAAGLTPTMEIPQIIVADPENDMKKPEEAGDDRKEWRADDKLMRLVVRMLRTLVETKESIQAFGSQMIEKDERQEERDEKANEWHQVAVALDRAFFFIYLACLFILALVSAAILFT